MAIHARYSVQRGFSRFTGTTAACITIVIICADIWQGNFSVLCSLFALVSIRHDSDSMCVYVAVCM